MTGLSCELRKGPFRASDGGSDASRVLKEGGIEIEAARAAVRKMVDSSE